MAKEIDPVRVNPDLEDLITHAGIQESGTAELRQGTICASLVTTMSEPPRAVS